MVIVVLLLVGVIGGAYFGGLLALAPIGYNTNTQVLFKDDSVSTSDATVFVPSGSLGRDPARPNEKELLDAVSYVTSWKSTGNSEQIEPQGNAILSVGYMKNARWKFFVACASTAACPVGGAVGTWGEVYVTRTDNRGDVPYDGIIDDFFADVEPLLEPAPAFSLVGSVDGWVRAELWGEFWSPGINIFDGDAINDQTYSDRAWLRDDAALVSGRGTITSPTQLSVFEVGSKISITVDVGSACSKKTGAAGSESGVAGYTLELYSQGQGRNAKTWDIGCGPGTFSVDKSGARLEYVIQQADFSNVVGDCKNQLEIKLLNDLYQKDAVSLRTIDIGAQKPAAPGIEVSVADGVWEECKTVTVKVITDRTDALVNIIIKNKATGAEVLKREKVTQHEFQFVPTTAGLYEVATSIEVDCRSSDPNVSVITIKEAQPPLCENCEPPLGVFPWLAVGLLIAGIIAILVAIFLPLFDLRIKFIIGAIGSVLILVAILSFTGAL